MNEPLTKKQRTSKHARDGGEITILKCGVGNTNTCTLHVILFANLTRLFGETFTGLGVFLSNSHNKRGINCCGWVTIIKKRNIAFIVSIKAFYKYHAVAISEYCLTLLFANPIGILLICQYLIRFHTHTHTHTTRVSMSIYTKQVTRWIQ